MCNSTKSLPKSIYSLSPSHLKPHPRPLSEWRGEWTLLVGWERMVSGNRGNCILKLRKRPSPIEKGVSSLWREPLFNLKRRPLYLQTMVITPLSIRRGVGGEAVSSFTNNGVHSPLHSERGWGWGCRWAGGEASFRKKEAFGGTHPLLRRGLGRLLLSYWNIPFAW